MSIEIKVPVLPESVSDATIATWYKQPGEFVKRDEHLVDIETDKVVLEVVAPAEGSLEKILKQQGSVVKGQEIIALFKTGAKDSKEAIRAKESTSETSAEKPATETTQTAPKSEAPTLQSKLEADNLSPAVRRLVGEKELTKETLKDMQGSGPSGRVTTMDIDKAKATENASFKVETTAVNGVSELSAGGARLEKRVPMTRLRARIAERLVQAQHTAAILTTFNEINMQPVITLRQKYKEMFEKNYGVRLGFMSFFTLAVVEALKHFPIINASIDGNDIVYHGYYDIGIAVSSPRGLVVPVLRNAENLSMDEIERQIASLAKKAEQGQLNIDEITGGTFTITNGGVFGSLMATPILNPPQSAILGMHKIQERPVVENGQIVICPMMYIALSYDHRIIDGAESVRFLVTVKELLEDPARLALGI